jgi:hypothetical protein
MQVRGMCVYQLGGGGVEVHREKRGAQVHEVGTRGGGITWFA